MKERWRLTALQKRGSKPVKELAAALMLIGLFLNVPAGYFVAFPGSDLVFTIGGILFVTGFLTAVLNAAPSDRIDSTICSQTLLAIGILALSLGFYWRSHRTLLLCVGILSSITSALIYVVKKRH